jgi:multidrug efflux pump subunit AcrB
MQLTGTFKLGTDLNTAQVLVQNCVATALPRVPVSLIGTFVILAALGFSLNNLSLFGLVLTIGIVVD